MYRPFETLRLTGRCVSVIGSGGKTTLLRRLSERAAGTVILTTSTHIRPFPGIPLVTADANCARVLDDIRAALAGSRVVCLRQPLPSGKLAAPDMPFEALCALADHVLVEADGAAGHPLKAHRPHEPVIPACSELTVCVVGASGIGRPVSQVCHCPGLFCDLAGITPDQPADEAAIARALNREALADVYIVNQVDALPGPERAVRLCDLIQKPAAACSLMAWGR